MKALMKLKHIQSILILTFLFLGLLSNFVILSLRLAPPNAITNFFGLGYEVSFSDVLNVYAFVLVILFYASFIPIVLISIDLFRKKQKFSMYAAFYLFLIPLSLLVIHVIYTVLTLFGFVILIISLASQMALLVVIMIRNRKLSSLKEPSKISVNSENRHKLLKRMLIFNIVAVIVFMTMFFVPVYTIVDLQPQFHAIIITALSSNSVDFELVTYFFVCFSMLLGLLLFFSDIVSRYFYDQSSFMKKSMNFINFIFVITIVFFVAGIVSNIFFTLEGNQVITISYIPVALMVFLLMGVSILKGKYQQGEMIEQKRELFKYVKIEPLLYVIGLTLISIFLLFVPIIVMTMDFGNFSYSVNLTGLKILTDYPSLDPGYRLVAYVLVVMLLSVGVSLILTISSYLSNFKQFNSIVRFSTIVNLFFIFIISIAGYYFQIAQAINEAIIYEMFEFYGLILPPSIDYTYSVGTNAIFVLILALALISVMFYRKAFERTDFDFVISPAQMPNESSAIENKTSVEQESEINAFDPCPAFTALDVKIPLFENDLEERLKLKTTHTSLNELIHFVVDYARNSRLHLSYTPEDIATFVAGLGASKLSILQGMSGTGKTSLPKIFAEAIFGNCEIIEVESSWKDKNELLGYYNEFSMKYTPKKFTTALYKAALNPNIFTFILLDEMNLSRIEYYFSDFLSLMENEEHQRYIKLININLERTEAGEKIPYTQLQEGQTLNVPKNVWFIGTANRDESTFVISDKVYDRAHTMNFTKRAPKIRKYSDPMDKSFYDYETMNKLFIEAKQQGDFDAEDNPLIKSVEMILAPFNISFGNRILKQIEDFVNIYKACFQNEDVEAEAIEKILLSKVVQKLETKTIDDKDKLKDAFLKLKLNQCAQFIDSLDTD